MKLQNPALANATLSLRFTRDEDGRPVQLKADAQGVFDFSAANPKDAALLQESPGWRIPRGYVPPAKPEQAATMAETVKNGPTESPPPAPAEEPAEEHEGPDIDAIRSRSQAQQIAEEYRALGYEIPELTGKLADMKAALTLALYGGEEG